MVPGVAAQLAGVSSLAAWLVVAFSSCAVAFALGSLQSHAPLGTSFAGLFTRTFGDRLGALLVVFYVIGSMFGVATVAAGLGQYLAYFGLGHLTLVEALIIMAMLALNLYGILSSGWTENLLSVVKIAGILAIIALLAPRVQVQSLVPSSMAPLPTLLQVVIIVYWPFSGFEISAIPVAEMKNPKAIAPALLTVMALVCAIYLGLNLVLLGAVGAAQLGSSPAPVAYAMGLVLPGSEAWVALLAIVTMLSALNAYVVGTSRSLQDVVHLVPLKRAAQLSTRGVPTAALLVTCLGAAGLLAFSNHFDDLAVVSVLMTLVPYAALCWAAFSGGRSKPARAIALFGVVATLAVLVLHFTL